MAASRFLNQRPVKVASPKALPYQKNNFAGGLDTLSAVEVMEDNCSPFLRNVRNVHQGSIGTRKGPGFYSNPGGETANTAQTSTTGQADKTITTTQWGAAKFIPTATGRLTKLTLKMKNASGATGPVVVELRANNAGVPATTVLATTSIPAASFTTSYQDLVTRFLEAPQVVNGTTYWIVAYNQSNGGSGTYYWASSTTYTTGLTSTSSGTTWASGSFGMNYQSYISTDGGTLGGIRFYNQSTGFKGSIIAIKEAAGTTGVYAINDGTGVITAVKTGLSSAATNYVFCKVQGLVVWVNGVDAAYQWDGTTTQAVPGSPPVGAISVALHKNRLFFLDGTNRVAFSDAASFTSYQATSFIYVPTPNSGDPVVGMVEFQDQLWFGTRKTKYVLYGSDLSSFVLRQSTAIKGMLSQTTMWVEGNYLYFASHDGVYQCNGASDQLLSKFITPLYLAIPNPDKGFLIVWQNNIRYYFAESGSSVPNAMLMFDLVNGGWFYDDNTYVQRAFILDAPSDTTWPLIECSSVVGAAYYAEQQYSGLGKPISMVYYDKPNSYGNAGVYKEVMFYYPRIVGETGSYSVDCQIDVELKNSPTSTLINVQAGGSQWGTAQWGSFTWGTQPFIEQSVPVSGEYRYFQKRWVANGADIPVEISGYTDIFLTKPPR